LGWTSNSCASSDSVISPLMAANATFALKAGVWFRRARLLIVSPDSRVNLARRQAETPLIPLFRFLRPALAASSPMDKQIPKSESDNNLTPVTSAENKLTDSPAVLRSQGEIHTPH
jgi:hypothetical protein